MFGFNYGWTYLIVSRSTEVSCLTRSPKITHFSSTFSFVFYLVLYITIPCNYIIIVDVIAVVFIAYRVTFNVTSGWGRQT